MGMEPNCRYKWYHSRYNCLNLLYVYVELGENPEAFYNAILSQSPIQVWNVCYLTGEEIEAPTTKESQSPIWVWNENFMTYHKKGLSVSISCVVMEVYNENHNKTILNVSISYMGMERTSLYRIVGTDDLYQSPIRVWNTQLW